MSHSQRKHAAPQHTAAQTAMDAAGPTSDEQAQRSTLDTISKLLGLMWSPSPPMPWLTAGFDPAASLKHGREIGFAAVPLQAPPALQHTWESYSNLLHHLEVQAGAFMASMQLCVAELDPLSVEADPQRWAVTATLGIAFPVQRRDALSELCARMNHGLPLGSFQLLHVHARGVTISFRACAVEVQSATRRGVLVADAVAAAAAVLEMYAPCAFAVGMGSIAPAIAVAMVEAQAHDSVGQWAHFPTSHDVGLARTTQACGELGLMQVSFLQLRDAVLPRLPGGGDPSAPSLSSQSSQRTDGGSPTFARMPRACAGEQSAAASSSSSILPPGTAARLNSAVIPRLTVLSMLSLARVPWACEAGSCAARGFLAALQASGVTAWSWDPTMCTVSSRCKVEGKRDFPFSENVDLYLDYTASKCGTGTRCLLRVEPDLSLWPTNVEPCSAVPHQQRFRALSSWAAWINASLEVGQLDVVRDPAHGAVESLWLAIGAFVPAALGKEQAGKYFTGLVQNALGLFSALIPCLETAWAGRGVTIPPTPPPYHAQPVRYTKRGWDGLAARCVLHGEVHGQGFVAQDCGGGAAYSSNSALEPGPAHAGQAGLCSPHASNAFWA